MPQRNVKRLTYLRLLFSAGLLGIFFSCHHIDNEKNIFRYNDASGISSLDPAFAKNQSVNWAIHQLYNTLVEVDSNMHIIPSIAKNWDISKDNLTYIFHLRTDVYFQDNLVFINHKGRKLLASDIVSSFQRITLPATASSGAWIFNDKVAAEQPFVALNDSTFQLRLVRPFQPILGILSMQYCSIIATEAIAKYGKEIRTHPCGTGPFELVAWDEGQRMILRKNKNYFERDNSGNPLPYIDGVKISFIDSKSTEFLLFKQKKLDFIIDIDASFKDEVFSKRGELKNEWKGKVTLQKVPFLNIEYLGILQDSINPLLQHSPLRNRLFRQALNYGIDRKKMILYLRNSMGIPAESGFVPAGLTSYDSLKVKGYHYDPAKALQLLKDAGYTNSNHAPIKLLTIPLYADLGSYIASELRQIGINIQIEVVQKSLLLEQTSKSEALFFRGSWIADYPDPENYLSVFYSKNPAPPNYTRYKNPAFDKLYEAALAEKNDSIRILRYQQADQTLIEDAPVVPLWYDMVVRMVQPYVSGFTTNSLNTLELRKVKLNK